VDVREDAGHTTDARPRRPGGLCPLRERELSIERLCPVIGGGGLSGGQPEYAGNVPWVVCGGDLKLAGPPTGHPFVGSPDDSRRGAWMASSLVMCLWCL
jgi:hypothetical protein